MESSGIGQEKVQSYYTSPTTSSLAQSGVHNSQDVKEVQVVAKLPSGSESSLKTLPHRVINGLTEQTLKLNHDDKHSTVFNEVVRRIKPGIQINIAEKIAQVTESEVEKILQCCDEPALILNGFHGFFTSDVFPYVNLRAFRDGKITVNEFATLASLHTICKENREVSESFEIKFQALFDENGEPNKEAWAAMEETLHKSNTERRSVFKYDIEDVLKKMQVKFKTARPLEAGFWHYDMPAASEKPTIVDVIRNIGSWALSGYANQEMIPSITMIQAFIDSAFGTEAHRINPVIGASSVDDVRLGGIGCFRDFALPFPDVPLPKIADYFAAPNTAVFQKHDVYHLKRASLLTNEDKDLYIKIGDALQEQKKRYESAISMLKEICQQRLDHIERVKDLVEKLPESKKKEAMIKFQKELYRISRVFAYLRRARKATGQLKFIMYDLEFLYASYAHRSIRQLSDFSYHLGNIYATLSYFENVESRECLNGMPAKLAGKVVLPLISGELDDPEEMYHNLCKLNDLLLRAHEGLPQVEAVRKQIDRCNKFIYYLKPR